MSVTVSNRESAPQQATVKVSSKNVDIIPSDEQTIVIPGVETGPFFVKSGGYQELSYDLHPNQTGNSQIIIQLFDHGSQVDFLTETLMVRDSYSIHVDVKSWLIGLPLSSSVEVTTNQCGSYGLTRAIANEIKPGEYLIKVPASDYTVEVHNGKNEERKINLNQDTSLTFTSALYWDTLLLLLPAPIVAAAYFFRIKFVRVKRKYEVRVESLWKGLAIQLSIALASTIIATLILKYFGLI